MSMVRAGAPPANGPAEDGAVAALRALSGARQLTYHDLAYAGRRLSEQVAAGALSTEAFAKLRYDLEVARADQREPFLRWRLCGRKRPQEQLPMWGDYNCLLVAIGWLSRHEAYRERFPPADSPEFYRVGLSAWADLLAAGDEDRTRPLTEQSPQGTAVDIAAIWCTSADLAAKFGCTKGAAAKKLERARPHLPPDAFKQMRKGEGRGSRSAQFLYLYSAVAGLFEDPENRQSTPSLENFSVPESVSSQRVASNDGRLTRVNR